MGGGVVEGELHLGGLIFDVLDGLAEELFNQGFLLFDLMALLLDRRFHLFYAVDVLHGLLVAEILDALGDFLDVLGAGLDIFTAVIEVLLCILLLVGFEKLLQLVLIQVFGNLRLRLPLLVGNRDAYLVDIDLFG